MFEIQSMPSCVFSLCYYEMFCLQFKILPVGLANFYIPSEEKQRAVLDSTSESPPDVHPSRIDRRLEDVRFEGFMRMLDGAVSDAFSITLS